MLVISEDGFEEDEISSLLDSKRIIIEALA